MSLFGWLKGTWRLVRVRRWLLPLYLTALLAVATTLWRAGWLRPEPAAVLAAALGVTVLAELGRYLVGVVRRLFWRIRYKLIVSYLFIAVAPLVVLGALALLVVYLGLGQFLVFLVSRQLTSVQDELERSRVTVMGRLELASREGQELSTDFIQGRVAELGDELGGIAARFPSVYAMLVVEDLLDGGQQILVPDGFEPPAWRATGTPFWFSDSETGFVTEPGGVLEIKSAEIQELGDQRIYVELSLPVDVPSLNRLRSVLGADVRTVVPRASLVQGEDQDFETSVEAESAVSVVPQEARDWALDLPIFGVWIIDTLDWDTGRHRQAGRLLVAETSPYGMFALASSFRAENNALVLTIVGLVVFVLIVLWALSFGIGLFLARSITGSVHALFVGTARIEAGELDYRIPVATTDQLGDLARSFNLMARSVKRLVVESAERERLEEELRIGRQIQQSLLPAGSLSHAGLDMAAVSVPAREVGGDYYDALDMSDGRLGIVIADVSGKGTSAAFLHGGAQGADAVARPGASRCSRDHDRRQPHPDREPRSAELRHDELRSGRSAEEPALFGSRRAQPSSLSQSGHRHLRGGASLGVGPRAGRGRTVRQADGGGSASHGH